MHISYLLQPLRKLVSVALVLFLLIQANKSSAQIISTYAGNGSGNESGDGSLASAAGVPYPYAVCVDAAGNLYITSTNKIRKVDAATGIITSIAGTGQPGFSGDGGPARNATMHFPFGICADRQGNIYVSEYNNQRIRKINTAGIISTVAGNGTIGFSGDNGPAVNATLNVPKGLCADAAGNVYFADLYNSRVRKIDAATGIITTIAGNGSTTHSGDGGAAQNAGVPTPVNVCLDANSNLYIVEVNKQNTNRIRKVNLATGIITTVAGLAPMSFSGDGGAATSATLFDPSAVCVDAAGNIYITTYDDGRVRKVDAATGIITTIAGIGSYGYAGDCGPPANAVFDRPTGICVNSRGDLYIADNFNSRVREISSYSYNTPEVTVTASDTIICPGMTITFKAINKSGNRFPVYQWMVDGKDVGTNDTLYTTNALSNGSVVTCRMTVPLCAGGSTKDFSDPIRITVSRLNPKVSIASSVTSICKGSPITFTTTFSKAGNAPTFQWVINGVVTPFTGYTFITSNLSNGDVVSCIMTVDPAVTCANSTTANSNSIAIKVNGTSAASVSITASDNNFCEGKTVSFTATPVNAGTPTYQWQVNGSNVGSNSSTYTSSTLINGDMVTCILATTNDCSVVMNYPSNSITMAVKRKPVITISPADTTVIQGVQVQLAAALSANTTSYTWSPAINLVNAQTTKPLTVSMFNTTTYTLKAITSEGCEATAEAIVRVKKKLFMPSSFTPNGDFKNDVFQIPPGTTITLKNFTVYGRWGNKIFTTSDISKGWDGKLKGIPLETGTYIYTITATADKEEIFMKGTVVLVR